MKLKKYAKSAVILLVATVTFLLSAVCVFAVPDESEGVVETEAVYTEVVTEAPTETVAPETEPPTQAETRPETQPETEEIQVEETEPEVVGQETQPVTYATTEAVTYTLPFANVIEEATAALIAEEDREPGDFTYGIASWVCVIIGVIVIVVVLISNKTQYHTGSGKHRYEEGDRITGKKRLLNDDYYNHRNAQSYFNKDTRR